MWDYWLFLTIRSTDTEIRSLAAREEITTDNNNNDVCCSVSCCNLELNVGAIKEKKIWSSRLVGWVLLNWLTAHFQDS